MKKQLVVLVSSQETIFPLNEILYKSFFLLFPKSWGLVTVTLEAQGSKSGGALAAVWGGRVPVRGRGVFPPGQACLCVILCST